MLLTAIPGSSFGQQCTGYALYKEDFGSDASGYGGGPLPAGVTSYEYTGNTPVEDGYYGIRKEVTGHEGTWFPAKDHTGDGYMMLINASYTPGLFYETRVTNLCQGNSFYFSAWVANLMRAGADGPLDPNLKFVIRRASDSAVINTLETGVLKRYATLTWEECGINFSLPAGESSLILQIFNNAGGGNGNDLVLDDISFSICGPAIQVEQAGVYGGTDDACLGNEVKFTANVDADFYHDPDYLWQFGTDTLHWQDIAGATTTSFSLGKSREDQTGWYRLLVSEKGNIQLPHCRIASEPAALNVKPPVAVDILANSPVCEGNPLKLEASAEALSYRWTGPGGFQSSDRSLNFENASVAQQGQYALTAVTAGGCVSNSATDISVTHNDLTVSLIDSVLCQGTATTLNAYNTGAQYAWNTGANTPAITIDTGGFYRVVVTKSGCQAEDSIMVRSILQPRVDLGNDTSICIGEAYTLDVTYPDIDRYAWQDGLGEPLHPVERAGTYAVTLSNACGTAFDAIHVKTEACADRLIFPTAFSPNGDGINDYFRPRLFLQVTHYELIIYDRWGRVVYQGKDAGNGWDGFIRGRKAPTGTYVWTSRYNRQRDDYPISQRGTVTLIR